MKPLEVIVVDDDSSDGTFEVAQRSGVKVIKVSPPEGWAGKPYACYSGANIAQGQFLLFLDADVRLKPNFIEELNSIISENEVLSIHPYHTTFKFYEDFSLMFNLVSILGILGAKDVCLHSTSGLFGHCVLFPRKLYFEAGGHELVKGSIIEDLELGLKLKRLGIKTFTIPGKDLLTFRMYGDGFEKLVFGWIKNFSTGAVKSSIKSLLQVFGIVVTPIASISGVLRNLNSPLLFSVYLSVYLAYLLFAFLVLRKIGSFRFWNVLIFPIHVIFFILIFLASVILKIFRVPVPWRGRMVK